MKLAWRLVAASLAVETCGTTGVLRAEEVAFNDAEVRQILSLSPLRAPSPDPTNRFADNEAAAHLGRFLFFDPRLSAGGKVSCATCHQPDRGFTDGRALAVGLGEGRRNTPAIWNVAYQRWLGHGGRFDSMWSQALGPIEEETEMGSTRLQVCRLVFEDAELRRAYEGIFGPMPNLSNESRFPWRARPVPDNRMHPDDLAWRSMNQADRDTVNRIFSNLGKAIAAYEQKLIGNATAFDEFVAGLRAQDPRRQESISSSAKRGLKLFLGTGNCILCHTGPNFSDGEFHNLSLPALGGGRPRDAGRFAAIGLIKGGEFNAASVYSDDADGSKSALIGGLSESPDKWGQFKTPGLRNVAKTAPYMHQGQFGSLREVVRFYSTLEGADQTGHHKESILVPLFLSDRQIDDLAQFLECLTIIDVNPELVAPPEVPYLVSETSQDGGK